MVSKGRFSLQASTNATFKLEPEVVLECQHGATWRACLQASKLSRPLRFQVSQPSCVESLSVSRSLFFSTDRGVEASQPVRSRALGNSVRISSVG